VGGIGYKSAAALLMLCALIACGEKDDARAIRKLIAGGAALAEQHQIADLMRLTADGFTAWPGRYDARAVRGILFATFRRWGRFEIHYPRPAVELAPAPDRATAVMVLLMVSKDREFPGLKELYEDPQGWIEAVGEKADLYQLRLDLIKKEGDWRVQQASIERFKGLV